MKLKKGKCLDASVAWGASLEEPGLRSSGAISVPYFLLAFRTALSLPAVVSHIMYFLEHFFL